MENEMTTEKMPNICLPDQNDTVVDLQSKINDFAVVFFYPKDLTSGCSKEALEFSEKLKLFEEKSCLVFGISPDKPVTHQKFIDKLELKVNLLSDVEKQTCQDYQVWKEKSMYGKKYFGVERSTFLLNKNLEIIASWRKVKVPGHVDAVYSALIDYLDKE